MKALIELLMKMGKTKEEALEIIGKDLPTGGIDNVSSNILKPITKKVVGDYPLVGSRITDPTSVKNFDLKSISESIADQEKNWKKTFEFLSEGNYTLSALQKQNLTYNLGILKRSKDTAKNLSSERFDALGKYLEKRDTLFGPEKADVFDLTGKKIDTSKPILGGKNVPESGPEVSGIREPKDFANIVGMRPTDETLNKLVEEHQNNLRLINQTDAEGGTAIGYEKFKALQKRNEEIEKIIENARKVADEEDAAEAIGKAISADSPEGKEITKKLFEKIDQASGENVIKLANPVDEIIASIKALEPIDAMKEANSVLGKKGKYKNLSDEQVNKIIEDTNDHIFERDIPDDPDFAQGGIIGLK